MSCLLDGTRGCLGFRCPLEGHRESRVCSTALLAFKSNTNMILHMNGMLGEPTGSLRCRKYHDTIRRALIPAIDSCSYQHSLFRSWMELSVSRKAIECFAILSPVVFGGPGYLHQYLLFCFWNDVSKRIFGVRKGRKHSATYALSSQGEASKRRHFSLQPICPLDSMTALRFRRLAFMCLPQSVGARTVGDWSVAPSKVSPSLIYH